MGNSLSFGSKKRPAGKQWRSKPAVQLLNNIYKNVDEAFATIEEQPSGISPGSITSTELASNSVVTAKINNGAVTKDKLAASAVTAAKVAGDTSAATAGLRIQLGELVTVTDAATADVASFVVPTKCILSRAFLQKTAGTGDTGDTVDVRTAANGAGSSAFGVDGAIDLDELSPGSIVLKFGSGAGSAFNSGATVYVHRTKGSGGGYTGDASAILELTFLPVV